MTSRRNAIKAIGLSALTGSVFQNSLALPNSANFPDDYWKGIRNQFMLDKDSVFFNPGTVGAMPKVVVEKMTAHLRYVAEHVTDWAYKSDNDEEFISGYNNLLAIRKRVARLINALPEESCYDGQRHTWYQLSRQRTRPESR